MADGSNGTGLATAGSRVRLRFATDERLMTFVRRGDPAAFETLYERHASELLSFCMYLLGSRQDAEDAVQSTAHRRPRTPAQVGKPAAQERSPAQPGRR